MYDLETPTNPFFGSKLVDIAIKMGLRDTLMLSSNLKWAQSPQGLDGASEGTLYWQWFGHNRVDTCRQSRLFWQAPDPSRSFKLISLNGYHISRVIGLYLAT